jgi:hypothetical protein
VDPEPLDSLSVSEVGTLLGAQPSEVEWLSDLGYLPEPSRGGRVGYRAFIHLLGRSLSNPRLRGLRIAERPVWLAVLAEHPRLSKAIARFRFLPGSLGEVVLAKLLLDRSLDEGDDALD